MPAWHGQPQKTRYAFTVSGIASTFGGTVNDPPVWVNVPHITFFVGITSTFPLSGTYQSNNYVTDANFDTIVITKNNVFVQGVTWDGGKFTSNGTGSQTTVTGHILTADDGHNSNVASSPFQIAIIPGAISWTSVPLVSFVEGGTTGYNLGQNILNYNPATDSFAVTPGYTLPSWLTLSGTGNVNLTPNGTQVDANDIPANPGIKIDVRRSGGAWVSSAAFGVTVTAAAVGIPSWVASRALLEAFRIPNTKLSVYDVSIGVLSTASGEWSGVFFGNGGPSNKINAWTGAALRQENNVYIIAAAGGHADYAGNEVDAIQLSSNTPTWQQVRARTAPANIYNRSSWYADSRPSSFHTYWNTQYNQALDRTFLYDGFPFYIDPIVYPVPPTYPGYPATSGDGVWPQERPASFRWADKDWDAVSRYGAISLTVDGHYVFPTVVDPINQDVYAFNNNNIQRHRASAALDAQRVVVLAGSGSAATGPAVIDSKRRVIWDINPFSGASGIRRIDISAGTWTWATATLSGSGVSTLFSYIAGSVAHHSSAVYDEFNDCIWFYYGRRDNPQTPTTGLPAALWKISCAISNGTFDCTQITPTGIALPNRLNGTHNALQLARFGGVAVLVMADGYDLDLFALKVYTAPAAWTAVNYQGDLDGIYTPSPALKHLRHDYHPTEQAVYLVGGDYGSTGGYDGNSYRGVTWRFIPPNTWQRVYPLKPNGDPWTDCDAGNGGEVQPAPHCESCWNWVGGNKFLLSNRRGDIGPSDHYWPAPGDTNYVPRVKPATYPRAGGYPAAYSTIYASGTMSFDIITKKYALEPSIPDNGATFEAGCFDHVGQRWIRNYGGNNQSISVTLYPSGITTLYNCDFPDHPPDRSTSKMLPYHPVIVGDKVFCYNPGDDSLTTPLATLVYYFNLADLGVVSPLPVYYWATLWNDGFTIGSEQDMCYVESENALLLWGSGPPEPWVANTVYNAGNYVIPTVANGRTYKCTTAGRTHATTQPIWPTTQGATVADGTAVWTDIGMAPISSPESYLVDVSTQNSVRAGPPLPRDTNGIAYRPRNFGYYAPTNLIWTFGSQSSPYRDTVAHMYYTVYHKA